jgi:hypothetical protein
VIPPNSVTESTAVGDLRAAFTVLAAKNYPLGHSDLDMLRGRVCAAVDEMKDRGALPERVIVVVKGLATDSGLRWSDVEMFERLVGWCVERYYAP